jgi:diacylglycerol kinase (ATP)
MRWLVLANPCAGTRNSSDRWHRRLCAEFSTELDLVLTTSPGHATAIAKQAKAYDGIVVVGGDGTVGEVLQGIDPIKQRLIVLPAGHGNCLARDLGLGQDGAALRALRAMCFRRIDLIDVVLRFGSGQVERRVCASTIASGYVADVVRLGKSRLAALGRHAYAIASLLVSPRRMGFTIKPEAQEERTLNLSGFVINNTRHLANFRAFRAARMDDGLIDVMELAAGWMRQQLHNAAVLVGSGRFGPARLRQVEREEWRFAEPGCLMIDGELLADVHGISVSCRRAALDCLVAAP